MYSKIKTSKYIDDYSGKINQIAALIHNADSILLGAGAGLSSSAGLTYSGKRFEKNFPDFIARYHFHDMYTAGFYPFETKEERWAYWSRHIFHNRYDHQLNSLYTDLLTLIKDKDYFVLTTNVDHCFQMSGFDKTRLFYTQGDYGLWQCSVPCHKKTYDNKEIVFQMVESQNNMRIPSELIPYCPVCGKPMTMNLRADSTFVQDQGWHEAYCRYEDYIQRHSKTNILYIELGVGGNTPGIIKYPFWQMTDRNPDAHYICINLDEAVCPENIESRSICLNMDISDAVSDLLENGLSQNNIVNIS